MERRSLSRFLQGLFIIYIRIGCQKVHFISDMGKLHKMFSCVGFRHMDFLKYSGKYMEADVTALYWLRWRIEGFSGRPCLEITGDYSEY